MEGPLKCALIAAGHENYKIRSLLTGKSLAVNSRELTRSLIELIRETCRTLALLLDNVTCARIYAFNRANKLCLYGLVTNVMPPSRGFTIANFHCSGCNCTEQEMRMKLEIICCRCRVELKLSLIHCLQL